MHSPQPEKIKEMFSKVAHQYDRANSVLSGGIHHLWRKKLVHLSRASEGMQILDCATGTGDLAIAFKKNVGSAGKVIGTDFCQEMLESAPAKALAKGLDIQFELADVMNLPYESKTFDVTSISFGIRNVSDPLKALSEMARVTKSSGRVMVLEFGQMQTPVISSLFNFYSEKVLPKIGGFITGQAEAYEYLQTSSAQFPCRGEFLKLMEKSGKFLRWDYHALTGGIAYIYRGIVK